MDNKGSRMVLKPSETRGIGHDGEWENIEWYIVEEGDWEKEDS